VSFVLVKANFKSVNEEPKFPVNSLSIVYRCAIHNLQTLTNFPKPNKYIEIITNMRE